MIADCYGRFLAAIFVAYIFSCGITSADSVNQGIAELFYHPHDEVTTRAPVYRGPKHVYFHRTIPPTNGAPPTTDYGPHIISPRTNYFSENETVEFECFGFGIGNISWFTTVDGVHRGYWRRRRQEPVEHFKDFFKVSETRVIMTTIGYSRMSSTIEVTMDLSLNRTDLICSVDGQPWKQDSVRLTVVQDHLQKKLGEPCTRNSNCPSNAMCDRVCACKYPYQMNEWKEECISARSHLESCHANAECHLHDINSICKNHACNCADGYVYTEGKCWRKVWLGDICKKNEDCSSIVEHSICRNVTSGGFSECGCEVGYRISGRRCVPHWRGNLLSLKLYFVICASSLGLILLCIFIYGARSVRLYVLQQKGRNSRLTMANEKNLSISKYIPMKSKPDLKVLEEKRTVTFCPLPTLDATWKPTQTPDLRPVSISEEDRTVGIPENIILITQDKNASNC